MAEEKKPQVEQKKPEKKIEEKKKSALVSREMPVGRIIRILQTDIPGNNNIYTGLTKIKGVSWSISNAVCLLLKFDKNRKMETISKEEIQKIEETLKTHNFPKFLLNRRNDFSTGEDKHLFGQALDLERELDIKRLKKIRSFRGLRHAMGQPTRGQSTKAHFRSNRKRGVGMKVKKPAVQGGEAK
jgi:small subunit ribosomal protein S13